MAQVSFTALLVIFQTGAFGVPISPNAELMDSFPAQKTPGLQSSLTGSEVLIQVQDVPQPQSPRMPSGPQLQLPTLTNPWGSQPNPNPVLSPVPAHVHYPPFTHPQQPQLFYYPIFGPQSRSPTFSYGVPVFPSQQYPAHVVPASRTNAQIHPNQPKPQRVLPFLFMVPQIQQRTAGPYGGLSSEELQSMEKMGHVNMQMPVFRGNVFPVVGPKLVNTFPANIYPATGTTFLTAEILQPSLIAAPSDGDATRVTGGSPPNTGALSRTNPQERDRVPCDHVQSAEELLTNTEHLSSGYGTSADVPTVQPDPDDSGFNPVTTFPIAEHKEAHVLQSPPPFSHTDDANSDSHT